MPDSQTPQLSVALTADHLRARLRADAIQDAAVLDLAREWAEDEQGQRGDDRIITAVDALANALAEDPSPAELDARVHAVEDASGMDQAAVEIDLAAAMRLRDELDAAIGQLQRFSRPRLGSVPSPRAAGEVA